MSEIANALCSEYQREAATTRTTLERIPEERFDWKPHERSWSFRQLGSHIANLSMWMIGVLEEDEIDVADSNVEPYEATSVADLVDYHRRFIAEGLTKLKEQTDESLAAAWTLRSGDHVIVEMPRAVALRSFIFNHLVHHRGQLTVYLRLCDVPVPSIYGPSADEGSLGS